MTAIESSFYFKCFKLVYLRASTVMPTVVMETLWISGKFLENLDVWFGGIYPWGSLVSSSRQGLRGEDRVQGGPGLGLVGERSRLWHCRDGLGPDVSSLLVTQLRACSPGEDRPAASTSSWRCSGGRGGVGAGREEQRVSVAAGCVL